MAIIIPFPLGRAVPTESARRITRPFPVGRAEATMRFIVATVKRPIRVLIAKPGLDGHDRGAKVLTLALRDEGMEVIYTGIRQTPESIVEAAIQETVDVVGLSSMTGGHMYHFPKVVKLLKERGMTDVLVIGGGIISQEDIPRLKAEGVSEVFGPWSSLKDIVDFIRHNVRG